MLFVVEAFFEQSKPFDVYIAMSPSLWWNQDALVLDAGRRLKVGGSAGRTLFLSSANEDNITPQTARLPDALRAAAPEGLSWHYDPGRICRIALSIGRFRRSCCATRFSLGLEPDAKNGAGRASAKP